MNELEKVGGKKIEGEQKRRIISAVKLGQDAALEAVGKREEAERRSRTLQPLVGQIRVRISPDGKKWDTLAVVDSEEEARDYREGFLKNNTGWSCCICFGNQPTPNTLNEFPNKQTGEEK